MILAIAGLAVSPVPSVASTAAAEAPTRYLVLLEGSTTDNGFAVLGDAGAGVAAVEAADGSVVDDLSQQVGLVVATATDPSFAEEVEQDDAVALVAKDATWKAFPSRSEAEASGALVGVGLDSVPNPLGASSDPLEGFQWGLAQVGGQQAHEIETGDAAVTVAVLDTGIAGDHPDFRGSQGTNVDCARGRDLVPEGPSLFTIADPCVDGNFHGTHVAGIVGAQRNGVGGVGVAPGVTLVPVKVCDTAGSCYVSAVVRGITYAGQLRANVANMSFFVDDDTLGASTPFKCNSDPVQRVYREALERSLEYAVRRDVTPVAALGNATTDLANPSGVDADDCDLIPAESPGVIGTVALGPGSELARYSNFGAPAADLAAPGGDATSPHGSLPGPCPNLVLSTVPGGWACLEGTSMAAPHTSGVAALGVSEFGKVLGNGRRVMAPSAVQSLLQSTAVDLGATGYDACFGHGRVDAARVVNADTAYASVANPPCSVPSP